MTPIPAEPQNDVPTITHHTLPDNAVILDVREDDEWELGHAPHAVHIPLGELEGRLDELPDGRPIVVTCRGGGRSSRAVRFLIDSGYEAVNLQGGMLAWCKENRPMKHFGPGIPAVR